MRRAGLLVPLLVLLAGCEAKFHDLRPPDAVNGSPGDVGTGGAGDAAETGPSADSTGGDVSFADGDTGDRPDSSTVEEDAGARIVAEGTFEPRDYEAQGTARLVELADGSWELRLGSDFQVESTPGPVVVLTTRETMGAEIKPGEGDKELDVLRSDSGADAYEVPGGPGSRRNAFIFCKPFGGEIGRAIMEAP